MKNANDVFSGLTLVALSAVGAFSLSSLPEASGREVVGPASLPTFAIVALAACGLLLVAQGLRWKPRKNYWEHPEAIKRVLCFFALFVAYLVGMVVLGDVLAGQEWFPLPHNGGFTVMTFLFLLIGLPMLGRRKPLEILLVSGLTTASLVTAFALLFQVMLP